MPPRASAELPACAKHPAFASAAPCARCGNFSCAACFEGAAAGDLRCGDCRAKHAAQLLPWDQRRELGSWRAFWRTVPEVMLRPDVTFARARPEGGTFDALWFIAIASFLSLITSIIGIGLLVGGAAAFMGKSSGGAGRVGSSEAVTGVFIVVAVIGFYLALGWFLTAVGVLFLSVLDHALIRLLGGAGSYDVTLRANALSMAPAVVGLIPFCGAYVWPVWMLVAKVYAYKGLHKLSTGRAAAAALVPAVGLVVLLGAAYALFIFLAVSRDIWKS